MLLLLFLLGCHYKTKNIYLTAMTTAPAISTTTKLTAATLKNVLVKAKKMYKRDICLDTKSTK